MPGQDKAVSSILFQDEAYNVVVIDIPRSLEESQTLPGQSPEWRIFSSEPPTETFDIPEPHHRKGSDYGKSASTQLADLMTGAAVENALNRVKECYTGTLCLPRLVAPPPLEKEEGEEVSASASDNAQGNNMNKTLQMPLNAEHIQGTIQNTRQTFLNKAPKFDLIVMDPPWPNRSVRRKTNSYSTAKNINETITLLENIPIAAHLAPNGLVAIWITNKPSIFELLVSPTGGMLAQWGLELVAEWTWLKVTTLGDPIFDVQSSWRKPWEKLLIAKRRSAPKMHGLADRVVIAVPDLHSRKPNLRALFGEILEPGYTGLEIFARNLTTGWWAWGNEPLLFQDAKYWQRISSD